MIVVSVSGGLVSDVSGVPIGVRVAVRDYDVESEDPEDERLETDDDGQYVESHWDGMHPGEATLPQVVETLRTCRLEELEKASQLAIARSSAKRAEDQIGLRRKALVAQLYAEGKIVGKNEQERTALENRLVGEDTMQADLSVEADQAKRAAASAEVEHATAVVNRQYWQERLAVSLALLQHGPASVPWSVEASTGT